MIVAEFDAGPVNDFLAALSGKALDQARMRAANKAAAMGKTEASKRIRKVWNLKAKTLSPRLTVIKTSSGMLPATIKAQSYPLSFSHFGATSQKGKGATYKLFKAGGRKNMTAAFLQQTRSGHTGFFTRMDDPRPRRHRGPVKGTSANVRPRLRILDHKAITVASMFKQSRVLEPVKTKVGEVLTKEFYRLLSL